jgi:hypothetical protein
MAEALKKKTIILSKKPKKTIIITPKTYPQKRKGSKYV